MADTDREARLMARLASIHERIQWMADEESRSAWVKGEAAQSAFLDEKEKLIDEAEQIIERLRQAGSNA